MQWCRWVREERGQLVSSMQLEVSLLELSCSARCLHAVMLLLLLQATVGQVLSAGAGQIRSMWASRSAAGGVEQ